MAEPSAPNREEQIRAAFARSLKAVHFAFVAGYRLDEEEAKEGAEALYDWFHRFNYRPGAGLKSAAELGDTLLLMLGACRLARDYQLWKLEGAPCSDELKRIIERDPREVATELLNRLAQEGG
ncbi:MAG: hypothetical protein ACRD1P_05365 [Thermoanaerobaculia bacterium]